MCQDKSQVGVEIGEERIAEGVKDQKQGHNMPDLLMLTLSDLVYNDCNT